MPRFNPNKNGSYLYITMGIFIGMTLMLGFCYLGYKFLKSKHHLSRYSKIDPLMKPKKNFNVFAATSLDRIFKDGKTLTKPYFMPEPRFLSAARNEYESFQIVISNGAKELKSVRLELYDDLVQREDKSKRIAKENISIRVEGYVPTRRPYYPVKFVGEWPDPLLPLKPVDIKPNEVQPFWVTIYVPEGTPAGLYYGFVEIQSENIATEMPIQIEVYDFVLPNDSHLKTAFDFYGHILDVRYPGKSKEEYEKLADQYIIDMLKHRMNPILNVDPSSPAEMAKVERYRALGLTNFSIGKKGGTFGNNWPEDDQKLEELLPLYRAYGETLEQNKLIDHQYLYTWDEGDMGNPRVAKVSSMIHRAYSKLKNMVCYHGIWNPKENPAWGKDIDIWCFQISNFVEDQLAGLRKLGIEIWMYASGPSGDGTPNLAMDFDSMDYRIIPWLSWKYDIKGFLYWCVNWWPLVDPFESAANTKWQQNGNGLLFYPGENGPIDSLRVEIFRDGMEDYEYLVLLKEMVEKFKEFGLDQSDKNLYNQAVGLLNIGQPLVKSMFSFSKDQTILMEKRKLIANAISKMKNVLEDHHAK